MLFIVYQTTNKQNGKIYVGSHRTLDLDDGYLGSGKVLKRAVKKYGVDQFERTILAEFKTADEMFSYEAQVVDEAFVSRTDTYNLKVGGDGGFDFINNNRLGTPVSVLNKGRLAKLQDDPEFRATWVARIGEMGRRCKAEQKGLFSVCGDGSRSWQQVGNEVGTRAALSPEARQKRLDSFAAIGHQQGESNSQHGTCWIMKDGESRKVKKIDLETWLESGWSKGRKIKR